MSHIVDIVMLSAGRSSRMGADHKLLHSFEGVPLVRRSAETALGSRARRVSVVVGHRADEIVAALAGLDVAIIRNAAFAEGLSSSLKAGFADAASAQTAPEGVLVMLADQPFLAVNDLDVLIAAFEPQGFGSIVVATAEGFRGNPVILSLGYGDEVALLNGDIGAKPILVAHSHCIRAVEIGEGAAFDVDTPEAMAEAQRRRIC